MMERYKVGSLEFLLITGIIFVFLCLLFPPEAFAQWSPFNGSGGFGYPGSFYGGYPGYGYAGSPYSAYPYIGDGNYSKYVLLGGSLVPREIFELLASSNWDTAQLGHALLGPYFQTDVMRGWTPYGYQQTYNAYGYGLSPEDQAIIAAGGVPSWFEMPDWEKRRPYRYGLPYGGYAGYVQSPPPPGYYGYPVPWED